MASVRTRCYIHNPVPPFVRIAGPIYVSSSFRNLGLSNDSSASVVVSGADILEEWIRPGMCWVIDDSDLGEPIWAGFVNVQPIPLFSDQLTIQLIGPKKAMLEIELAVRLPINSTRAYAVSQAMEAAQIRHGGIYPGDIDPTEGVAEPIDVRGETISDFINTLHDETGTAEWRERVESLYGGDELIFYLDFGKLQHPTDIVLGRRDLSDGFFTRERIPSSLTLVGSNIGFEQRATSTVALESGTVAGEPTAGTLSPLDADTRKKISERVIGPASSYHVTQISERINGDLAEFSRQRHIELLQKMDEVLLTLDMTRTNTQAVRLGDIIRLQVQNWGGSLNIDVNLKLHVVQTDINANAGERTLECRVVN